MIYALIIVAAIIAIPFIIAAFKSSEFRLEKSVVINKPKNEVFNYVKNVKNQNDFAVWMAFDPNMKREYTGTDGTVGFVSAWESDHKKVGAGRQTITGIKEGEIVDMKIEFLKPWQNTSNAYFKTETVDGNQTKVTWGFLNPSVKYPMKVMQVVMDMDKMIGKDFEQGLQNMKKNLEK